MATSEPSRPASRATSGISRAHPASSGSCAHVFSDQDRRAQVELAPDLLSVLSDENSSLTSRSRQKWAEAMGELVQRNAHVYGFFSSTAILHETIHREPACHLNYKTFNVDRTVSDVAVEQQYIGACSGPETHI